MTQAQAARRRQIRQLSPYGKKYTPVILAAGSLRTGTAAPEMPTMVMLSDQPDHLVFARYLHPSRVRLTFADGHTGTYPFRQLELDMSNMKVASLKASLSGTSLEVKTQGGEHVEIDSASLRAMVDQVFKAERDQAFVALRGPLEDLIVTSSKK